MRLNPAAFDRWLNNVGQTVLWQRSYGCACVNPSSGAPDPKHQLCAGKGRIWDAPVQTVVGVASQTVQAEWQAAGLYEAGDMVMSIQQASPMWDAGQFDKITLKNSTDVFSQPLVRGGAAERILFPVSKFSRCFWLHPTTRAIIEGGLPVVSADGHLSWPNGGEPPAGATYSLTGEKFDVYFVFQGLPSDRNEHQGARLPKKLVARKWDLMGR